MFHLIITNVISDIFVIIIIIRTLTGSFVYLIPKGVDLFSLKDPIHIPSVLVGFTAKPEIFSKSSSNLKRVCAELISEKTAVLSSAY